MSYIYLAIAIVAEVSATSALKAAAEFDRLLPAVVVVVGYATALLLLSLTLRSIPVAVAYGVWSGAGTSLVALTGYLLYGQSLDGPAIAGLGLIVAGVVLINGWSSAASL